MPQAEQFSDLTFPASGVDLAEGFQGQRPGTTRQGVNVRACEPATQRLRGGARPGLSKYLPQLPNGARLVQHLGTVVRADGSALLANFVFPAPYLVDPSSPGQPADWPAGLPVQDSRIPPGQVIPQGGTGVQPNKRVPMQGAVVPQTIQFVQAASSLQADTTKSQAYDSAVTAGNLLIAVVKMTANTGSIAGYTASLSDSLGNSWVQAGTYYGDGSSASVSLWYCITAGGADAVTATASGPNSAVSVGIAEYSGVSHTDTLDDVRGQGGFPAPGTMTTPTVGVQGSGELLFGVFGQTAVSQESTPGSGFTRRPAAITNEALLMEELIGPSGDQAATATNNSNTSNAYGAIGVSFKPAG